jgi:hypothetical protein
MACFFVASNLDAQIRFSPDGSGRPPFSDVVGFDWLAGNALAHRGLAAQATFLNTATVTRLPSGPGVFDYLFTGGTQDSITRLAQATLGLILRADSKIGSPVDQITFVAGFGEVVESMRLTIDTVTGQQDLSSDFEFDVSNPTNFFEVYADRGPVTSSDNLNGTGFNDGTRILEGIVLPIGFSSNFTLDGDQPIADLDQAGSNNYDGPGGNPGPSGPAFQGPIRTLQGSGASNFTVLVTSADPDYFLDDFNSILLTTFVDRTDTVPFDSADPSARFVFGRGGDGVSSATLAGAGLDGSIASTAGAADSDVNGFLDFSGSDLTDPDNPVFSVAALNSDFQSETDGSNSFRRIPRAIPEPSSLLAWVIIGILCGAGRFVIDVRRPHGADRTLPR